jgi:hypothetical protein
MPGLIAASLVKLKLFSKSFGETWACGRSWAKLRFTASPPSVSCFKNTLLAQLHVKLFFKLFK